MKKNVRYPAIKAEIYRNNYTIESFCKAFGVDKKMYYRWQNGKAFDIKYLKKMTEFFNCSADYLLGLKDNMEPESQRKSA
jgi:transcriptional regulator with XRE-family HTH domain